MSILFYDYLVDFTPIEDHLNKLEADVQQKSRLRHLADEVLHHGILEYILQKLHPHYHHEFLTRLEQLPHDRTIMTFLEQHASPTIENELRGHAQKMITIILTDLTISEQ